tara:strand:- start:74 stop:622 length:549 start_codon:yes stop_codon:yes gene_type:complete
MRELNINQTIQGSKLHFNKSLFNKILDAFPVFILTVILPPFIFLSAYFSIKGDISFDYIFLSILGSLFFAWFISGWVNRGKIKLVKKINKSQAIEWIDNELKNGNVRDLLNRINENYIGLRYGGLSTGAFNSDVYLIFKEDNVYVTSIATGQGDDASPFHYFINKSKTIELINKLNSTQHGL